MQAKVQQGQDNPIDSLRIEFHPERTVLYRALFHYFERFVAEYEGRFEREYGDFRPIVKEVVEKYLDCGNPRGGYARIRCPDCGAERFVMFSCRTRGFCSKGWEAMIRKVYEIDPSLCPKCGGPMKAIC